MALLSTISSKGQVTVPIEVRHRLGLKEGDRVEFVFEDGRTILRPAQTEDNPFLQFLGALPAFKTREEIIAWHRELRDDDPWEKNTPKNGEQ
jgi:AbrB family looped-hinge helix DNA binding protein